MVKHIISIYTTQDSRVPACILYPCQSCLYGTENTKFRELIKLPMYTQACPAYVQAQWN